MDRNDLVLQVIDRQIEGLESVKEFTQTPEYAEFVGELYHCLMKDKGRIYISGVGKNSNIATKISESMASLGVRSGYINPTNYLHGDAGYIEKGDVVIHISRSGKTDEMHAMAKHLYHNRPRIKQYLIHANEDFDNYESGPLDWYFYKIFMIKNIKEGDHLETAPNTSTTAFLCLLDTITAVLSYDLGFTKEDFLKYHPGGNLGNILKKELEEPAPWETEI